MAHRHPFNQQASCQVWQPHANRLPQLIVISFSFRHKESIHNRDLIKLCRYTGSLVAQELRGFRAISTILFSDVPAALQRGFRLSLLARLDQDVVL